MKLKIKALSENAVIPKYQTKGASGFDFHAARATIIKPFHTEAIPTDLSFEIPEGYEIQVRPRSGLSLKTSLRVANAPGSIDADFRGNVCIIITNHSRQAASIPKGERIAQGVVAPVLQVEFEQVEELSPTERGEGGFGSTGSK